MYTIAALTKYEIESLKATKGGLEWEAVRISIMTARSGFIPHDWNEEVVASGLIDSKIAEWNAPTNSFVYTEWSRDTAAL